MKTPWHRNRGCQVERFGRADRHPQIAPAGQHMDRVWKPTPRRRRRTKPKNAVLNPSSADLAHLAH
jgi:hypothetical protein